MAEADADLGPADQQDLLDLIHDDRHQDCHPTAELAPEIEAITPSELREERTVAEFDQYIALSAAVYQTLTVKAIEGQQVIWTEFLTYGEDQLAAIRGSTPLLAQLKPSLVGLFQVFQLLKNGVTGSRDARLHAGITAVCTTEDINQRLAAGYRKPGENEAQANFVAIAFLRFVATVVDAATHLHNKSRVLLSMSGTLTSALDY